jgi:hypothetical protein
VEQLEQPKPLHCLNASIADEDLQVIVTGLRDMRAQALYLVHLGTDKAY